LKFGLTQTSIVAVIQYASSIVFYVFQ